LIQDEIDSARAASLNRHTVLGLIQELMKGNDWGVSEIQFLRSITAQEFKKEIKAATGSELQLLLQKGFELATNRSVPEGDYGNAPQA
ncbi:hypothetical protein SB912_29235, partial [Pantoea sp. SIMBA_072]